MKKRISTMLFVAGHLAEFGVGWLAWKAGGGKIAGGLEIARQTRDAREHERPRRTRGAAHDPAERLLDRLIAEAPLGNQFKGWGRWAEDSRERYRNLLAQAEETAVADDPAAAALAAMEGLATKPGDATLRSEATVRLIHWLRVDPAAAIKASFKQGGGPMRLELQDAALAVAMEKGPDEVGGWLKNDGTGFGTILASSLSRQMAASGDLAGIRRMKEHLDPQAWSAFRRMAADAWPLGRADELIAFCREEGSMVLMGNLASANGADGALWIGNLLASGKLDEAEQEAIRKGPMYAELMRKNPTVDMETRLEVLTAYRPGMNREEVGAEIMGRDVFDALRKEKDYRYAFRNGVMSADEVLAEVSRQLPHMAAESPDALRENVFRGLVKDDGARALRLLDHLPGQEKWDKAMAAAFSFDEADPQSLHDYLRAVPVDASPDLWRKRMDVWMMAGAEIHLRLGADYLAWVKQLPEGLDKDMASYALVSLLGSESAGIAADLSSNIRDPKIRGMLPTPP
ncbi:hypothetical protein OVA24_18040 [Luteolibacter sp. SL250]|uniref:hypothetical protein n=1 Tax=Luteolibacter sp. SL250 TaxID=2995170 RepID=UPI00226E4026|nr:hypothetical protein [Luteolibacter sp. SL250]WAC19131.1 hypothetical protein OVA24_18040 [Luteolibacter sp. SL250]